MNNYFNIKKLIYLICITCLVSWGCTDDNVLPASQTTLSTKTVPVKLNLGIENYNTSPTAETRSGESTPVLSTSYPDMDVELVKTPVTRATPAAVINEENAVYSYIILQFNGTGKNATLKDKNRYECPNGIIQTDKVQLQVTTTPGNPNEYLKHRFVIVANVDSEDFATLYVGTSTYSDFQGMFFRKKNNSIFPLHKVSLADGTKKDAIIMCGMTLATIRDTQNEQISVGLQRTVAKITFNIKTDNPNFAKFKNWDVALVNIPSKSYYNTLGRSAIFPDMTVMKENDAYWSKVFTGTEGVPLPIRGESAYIPINLQQTVPTSTHHSRRDNAPIGGTYLQIMGRAMKVTGFLPIVTDYVIYQIFIGNNLTTDFSIYPNHNLTYNITLKDRVEDDSNVIRFIPGYFSGKLTAYDSNGTALTAIDNTNAVKWQYSNRIEAYFADARYPRPSVEGTGKTDVRWYADTDPNHSFNNSGATSIMNGFENTRRLQTGSYYNYYPAAFSCYEGLSGIFSPNQSNFTWYLPSIGELIGTWISAASTAPTLSPSYWSSTAAMDNSVRAFIITTQGEVKLVAAGPADANRHYVRGVRNPDAVNANQ